MSEEIALTAACAGCLLMSTGPSSRKNMRKPEGRLAQVMVSLEAVRLHLSLVPLGQVMP